MWRHLWYVYMSLCNNGVGYMFFRNVFVLFMYDMYLIWYILCMIYVWFQYVFSLWFMYIQLLVIYVVMALHMISCAYSTSSRTHRVLLYNITQHNRFAPYARVCHAMYAAHIYLHGLFISHPSPGWIYQALVRPVDITPTDWTTIIITTVLHRPAARSENVLTSRSH